MEPAQTLHFHPDDRAAVQPGEKRTIIRWQEPSQPGPVELYFGDDPQPLAAQITQVEPFPLAALTEAQAQADGFADRAELLARLRSFTIPICRRMLRSAWCISVC
ncbi:ASCH domain-containing protein [Deinococcus radiophilus]|uniref:ASCH domain-containing protein n=1 Tax=Deinococcus radiophilus TaxID=32062 RepID=UPI001E51D3FB|nr:ASCH domain-containing protein [Deinococcus radiophilus]UFA50797.1 hypothetical protein LMT64_02495 [Deinococcus radiophilus]